MDPISPINAAATPAPQRLQPADSAAAPAAGATTTSAAGATSAHTTSISSTSSISGQTINQQVEGFLGSVSPALANNQYLKLLIAALIMQFLLGDDNSKQQTGQGGLAMLENLTGSRQNALYMSIESSTNSVQIQNDSSRLDVTTAVQSMSDSQGPTNPTGSEMDITG